MTNGTVSERGVLIQLGIVACQQRELLTEIRDLLRGEDGL
jgi:hypothetical protein